MGLIRFNISNFCIPLTEAMLLTKICTACLSLLLLLLLFYFFYFFFYFDRYDRISTYAIHSMIIALIIRHQSVFDLGKVRTQDLLFNDKRLSQLEPTPLLAYVYSLHFSFVFFFHVIYGAIYYKAGK